MFKSIKYDFHKSSIKLSPYRFNIVPIRNKFIVKNISDDKNINIELFAEIIKAQNESNISLEKLELLEAKLIINNIDNSGLDAWINNARLSYDITQASKEFIITYNKIKILKARKLVTKKNLIEILNEN